MTTPDMDNSDANLGMSRQALSIARILERLPAGEYTVNLRRPERRSERWTVEVFQVVVALKEIVDHSQDENKSNESSA